VFTQKDAKQQLLIGCSVPFEGSQQLVGQAVFSALKMAVTQLVPKELPGVNVNVTCINSKCEDIPAYMAVSKFAAEGASELNQGYNANCVTSAVVVLAVTAFRNASSNITCVQEDAVEKYVCAGSLHCIHC
jgi:hypothetical protein